MFLNCLSQKCKEAFTMKELITAVFLVLPLFSGALPQNGNNKSGVECYKCSSDQIANCAINPAANLPKVFCKDPKDQCITAIVNGVTQRGCKNELKARSDAISTACTTSQCNNKLFPEDRLKCYQCKGTDCAKNFQTYLKPCVNYVKDDHCITNVIDENDAIRGCQSDSNFTEESFVQKCQKSGCNNQPTSYIDYCIACSEKTLKSCSQLSATIPCGKTSVVPKDNSCTDTILLGRRPIQCFTYKTSEKFVRGCLKNAGKLNSDRGNLKTCEGHLCNTECLPPTCIKCDSKTNPKCVNQAKEFKPVLCATEKACFSIRTQEGTIERGCKGELKNATETSVCYQDGCNIDVLPIPIECYKCDSKHNAKCATKPSARLPHDQCKDPQDKCITAIVDGITFRGCEKEVNVPIKALSQKCDSKLCNIEIFPKDRLKCYQCTGNCCVTDFKKHLQPCVNYNENNSCVTVVEDEKNVVRKCASDPGFSAPKYAAICQGSACNNHSATYTAECSSCSQTDPASPSCVRVTSPVAPGTKCSLPRAKTCTDSLLLNRPISCFTYKKSGKVVRGCAKNAGEFARDVDNFKTCEGPMCNNECLPIKCVSCDSRVDPKCFNNTKELELKKCSSDMACYVGQTPDGEITRGCGEKSKEANYPASYKPCYFDGCNNKDFPVPKKNECYKCNSKDLAECATKPSAKLPHDRCKDPKDDCITAIVDGVTFRGCEKEVKVPIKALSQKCDSKLCNIEIFPKDRLKCYQCTGNCCVTDFKKHLQPCVNYNENNSCVTVVEDEKNVVRKCASDPGFSAPKYAAICQGSACNNHSATYTAECSSCSQTDPASPSCVRVTSPVAPGTKCSLPRAKTCTDSLLLNRPISCFTYKKSGKVVRGCAKNAGEFARDVDNFKTCEGPMCNNECLPIKCVSCDSRVDPKCFNNTKELELKKCSGDMACYVGQTSDEEIIRGCGVKSKETNQTTPCYFDGCNNKDFPVPKKIECSKCNSHDLAACATSPSANLPHVQCKDHKDKCYTAIFKGITYRGCEKEIEPFNQQAVIDKCNSSLCNVEVYPKDRLKCYQCEGKNCVKDFQKYLKPCAKHDTKDLCVTIVKDVNNVIRKCLSDPGTSDPKDTCKGSGCNKQPATYTAECISCSETSNTTSCARGASFDASGKCKVPKVTTCTDTPLLNQPISCFTYKMSGKVVRGCTKDAGKLALDTKNFETCKGQWCNNDCVPIKCVSCDSRVNQECAKETNKLEPQLCSNETTCFIGQTQEGAIIRGCGSNSKGAVQIKSCSTDGCNKVIKIFPPITRRLECYNCVSTTLTECALNPSPNLPRGYCKDANDQCATAVVDGVTYRGCEKELNAPANSISGTCNSNLCNVEHFKVPHSEMSPEPRTNDKYDESYYSNNYNNNNNSNNNSNNKIFVQIINFNFDKKNNSSDKALEQLNTATLT